VIDTIIWTRAACPALALLLDYDRSR